MKEKLKIIPLGGLNEIGKNMTVIEYGGDIVVIDCGVAFPDDDMLGVDLVIPDTTYLSNAVNNYFGCNFKRLINSYRVVRAKELLDGKDCPVNELFSRCGFASKSVFYVAFRKVVGMTPLQYISQSRNPFMIQRN